MNNMLTEKSVFLITIDALRLDHLKAYGYHRNTAPNLEEFLERGTQFLNAISNGPETPSSFSAIFSSILPLLDGGYSPFPAQKITFTQLLNENKIFSYGIHSNPNLSRFFNYDKGFNEFFDGERYKFDLSKKLNLKQTFSYYLKKIINYKDIIKKILYSLTGFNKIKTWLRKKIPKLTDLLLPFTPIAYNAPYLVNRIISFLNNYNGPLFLWVHFMDVHSPFNPPTENLLRFRSNDISIDDRYLLTQKIYQNPKEYNISQDVLSGLKDLYDAEINCFDSYLAKLLQYFKFKFKKDCLIIITADHGESFYEHGFFNHQGNIFDELLKVPLFIIDLGEATNIKKIDKTVQLIDIGPTILDYFSIDIPEYFQGKTLLPLLKGKTMDRKPLVISECYQKDGKMKKNEKEGFKLISLRTNEWKYIFDEEKNNEYLFHIKIDPNEEDNLVNREFSKFNEFRMIKDYHLHKIIETNEKTMIIKAIDKIDI